MAVRFNITLEAATDDGAAELRALRFALNRLGRQYHFRCKAIWPLCEPDYVEEASSKHPSGLVEAGAA